MIDDQSWKIIVSPSIQLPRLCAQLQQFWILQHPLERPRLWWYCQIHLHEKGAMKVLFTNTCPIFWYPEFFRKDIHYVGWSKKTFFLVGKKQLNHRCQYVWRAQISIFRLLSQKMAVFKHFLVLEGDIAEGISKNLIWAITFDWSVLRT